MEEYERYVHSEYLSHSGIRGIILVVELIVVPPTTISLFLFSATVHVVFYMTWSSACGWPAAVVYGMARSGRLQKAGGRGRLRMAVVCGWLPVVVCLRMAPRSSSCRCPVVVRGQRRKVGEIGFDRSWPGSDPLVGRSTPVRGWSVAVIPLTTLASIRAFQKKRRHGCRQAVTVGGIVDRAFSCLRSGGQNGWAQLGSSEMLLGTIWQ